MFCSNCGSQMSDNGICPNCGSKATNTLFTGNMQGQPVIPQQQFYNPNPMYVQYVGPTYGVGNPNMTQQMNVAIRGIKDQRILGGIGNIIKNCSGSMMMVMVALITTVVAIFSYINMVYIGANGMFGDLEASGLGAAYSFFFNCIPYTLFAIGGWCIVFSGYGTYTKKAMNDNACMGTAGFSCIQAGAIASVVVTGFVTLYTIVIFFMLLIGGVGFMGLSDGEFYKYDMSEYFIMVFAMIILMIVEIFSILTSASAINQMSNLKHGIIGRNYEKMSIFLPVMLYLTSILNIIVFVIFAVQGFWFEALVPVINAIWGIMAGSILLSTRTRIDSYVSRWNIPQNY